MGWDSNLRLVARDITGTVNHHWFDRFDWNEGQRAYIPEKGVFYDNDGLLLQECIGAKPFDMKSDWTQKLKGEIQISRILPDKVSFVWTGP